MSGRKRRIRKYAPTAATASRPTGRGGRAAAPSSERPRSSDHGIGVARRQRSRARSAVALSGNSPNAVGPDPVISARGRPNRLQRMDRVADLGAATARRVGDRSRAARGRRAATRRLRGVNETLAERLELERPAQGRGDRPPCTRPRSRGPPLPGSAPRRTPRPFQPLDALSGADQRSTGIELNRDVGADLGCQPLEVVHLVAREAKHRGGVGAPPPSPRRSGSASRSRCSAEGATSPARRSASRARSARLGRRRRRTAPRRAAHRRSRCGPTGSTHRSASRARAGRRDGGGRGRGTG